MGFVRTISGSQQSSSVSVVGTVGLAKVVKWRLKDSSGPREPLVDCDSLKGNYASVLKSAVKEFKQCA